MLSVLLGYQLRDFSFSLSHTHTFLHRCPISWDFYSPFISGRKESNVLAALCYRCFNCSKFCSCRKLASITELQVLFQCFPLFPHSWHFVFLGNGTCFHKYKMDVYMVPFLWERKYYWENVLMPMRNLNDLFTKLRIPVKPSLSLWNASSGVFWWHAPELVPQHLSFVRLWSRRSSLGLPFLSSSPPRQASLWLPMVSSLQRSQTSNENEKSISLQQQHSRLKQFWNFLISLVLLASLPFFLLQTVTEHPGCVGQWIRHHKYSGEHGGRAFGDSFAL